MKTPHAPATEKNRQPILDILRTYLTDKPLRIFEIGSGTGQHGIFFCKKLPKCTWIFSDLAKNHEGIQAWIQEDGIVNCEGPVHFEMGRPGFSIGAADMVFTANTLHIAPWESVALGLDAVGGVLKKGQYFMIYGPFNYDGKFTSESNQKFDGHLKQQNSEMGIRNFEDVSFILKKSGMNLLKDHPMPANNHLLVFEKS